MGQVAHGQLGGRNIDQPPNGLLGMRSGQLAVLVEDMIFRQAGCSPSRDSLCRTISGYPNCLIGFQGYNLPPLPASQRALHATQAVRLRIPELSQIYGRLRRQQARHLFFRETCLGGLVSSRIFGLGQACQSTLYTPGVCRNTAKCGCGSKPMGSHFGVLG